MTASPAFAAALEAGAVATGVTLLFWGSLYTPVGIFIYLLIDNLVVGPLGGLGWVDMEKEQDVRAALHLAFGVMAGLIWLFSFRLSFLRFKAAAERKARIREQEEYE
jgi:hypothetical protein